MEDNRSIVTRAGKVFGQETGEVEEAKREKEEMKINRPNKGIYRTGTNGTVYRAGTGRAPSRRSLTKEARASDLGAILGIRRIFDAATQPEGSGAL